MADVSIVTELSGLSTVTGGLAQIDTQLKGLGTTSQSTSAQFARVGTELQAVGAKVSLMAAPVGLFGASIIRTAADFQTSMAKIGANTDATTAQLERLAEQARVVGADTTFSASQAADAMLALAKNGIDVADMMAATEGAISPLVQATVDLAAATKTDLAFAADVAAKSMQQFKASGEQLPDMMNRLYGGTVQSTMELDDFALALGQTGGVAASAGVDFGELIVALTQTSAAFFSGSDAGTSMKTFLSSLSPTTKPAIAAMEELGLYTQDTGSAFYDASGNLKPMREIVALLEHSFAGLTEEQRINAAQTIFGTDAYRTAFQLAAGGVAEYDRLAGSIENASTKQAAMAISMAGFWGAWNQLSGAIENLSLAVADSGLLDWAEAFVRGLADVVNWVALLDPAILRWVGALGLAATAAGPVLIGLGLMSSALGALLPAFAAVASPVALVVAGLGAAGVAAYAFSDDIAGAFGAVTGYVAGLFSTWDGTFAALGTVVASAWSSISATIGGWGPAFASVFAAVQGAVVTAGEAIRSALVAMFGPETVQAVTGALGTVYTTVTGWGTQVLGYLGGFVPSFLQPFIGLPADTGAALAPLSTTAGAEVNRMGEVMYASAIPIPAGLTAALRQGLPYIAGWVEEAGTVLLRLVETFSPRLVAGMESLGPMVGSALNVVTQTFTGWWDTLSSTMTPKLDEFGITFEQKSTGWGDRLMAGVSGVVGQLTTWVASWWPAMGPRVDEVATNLGNAAAGWWSTVSAALAGFAASLATWAGTLWAAMSANFGTIGSGIATAAGGWWAAISQAVAGFASSLATWAGGLWASVSPRFGEIATGMAGAAGGWWATVSGAVSGFATSLATWAGGLWEGIADEFGEIATGLATESGQWWEDVSTELAGFATSMAGWAGELWSAMATPLANIGTSLADTVRGWLPATTQAFKEAFEGDFSASARDSLDRAILNLRGADSLLQAFDAVLGWLVAEVKSMVVPYFTTVPAAFAEGIEKGIGTAIGTVAGSVLRLLADGFVLAIGAVGATVVGAVKLLITRDFWQGLTEGLDATMGLNLTRYLEGAFKIWDGLIAIVQNAPAQFQTALHQGIVQPIIDLKASAVAAAQGVYEGVYEWLVTKWTTIRTEVVDAFNVIPEAIDAAKAAAVAKAQGLFTEVKDWLTTKLQSGLASVNPFKVTEEQAAALKDTMVDNSIIPDMVTAILAEYDRMAAGAKEKATKAKDDTLGAFSQLGDKLEEEIGKAIRVIEQGDWGLPAKMAAFDELKKRMEAAGTAGSQGMLKIKESIDKVLEGDAGARLKAIFDDSTLSANEQLLKVQDLRAEFQTYGEDAAGALQDINDAARELNEELASQDLERVFSDTTLTIREQYDEVVALAEKYQAMGDDGAEALAKIKPELEELNQQLREQDDILLNVQTQLARNVDEWGGWGKSAGDIVATFSRDAKSTLSDFFQTGKVDADGLFETIKKGFADEAAEAVVSFTSQAAKDFLAWVTGAKTSTDQIAINTQAAMTTAGTAVTGLGTVFGTTTAGVETGWTGWLGRLGTAFGGLFGAGGGQGGVSLGGMLTTGLGLFSTFFSDSESGWGSWLGILAGLAGPFFTGSGEGQMGGLIQGCYGLFTSFMGTSETEWGGWVGRLGQGFAGLFGGSGEGSIGAMLGTVAELFTGWFSSTESATGTWIGSLGTMISGLFGSQGDASIGGMLGTVAGLFDGFFSSNTASTGGWIDTLFSTIGGLFGGEGESSIGSMLTTVAGLFDGFFSGTGSEGGAGTWISGITDVVSGLFGDEGDSSLGGFLDLGMSLLDGFFTDTGAESESGFGGWGSSIMDLFGSVFGGEGDSSLGGWLSIGTDLLDTFLGSTGAESESGFGGWGSSIGTLFNGLFGDSGDQSLGGTLNTGMQLFNTFFGTTGAGSASGFGGWGTGISGIFSGLFGGTGSTLGSNLGIASGLFDGFFGSTATGFGTMGTTASSTFSGMGTSAALLFANPTTAAIAGVVAAAAIGFTLMGGDWGDLMSGMQNLAEGAMNAIKGLLEGLFSLARTVFAGIMAAAQAAFQAISSVASSVLNAIGGLLNGLLNIGRTVFGGILSVGQAAFQGIGSVAQSVIGGIGTALGGLGTRATQIFGSILGGAQRLVGQIGGMLGGITGGLGNIVGNIGDLPGTIRDWAGTIGDQLGGGDLDDLRDMLGDIGFGNINIRDFLRGDLFRDILGGLDLDFDIGDIFDGIGDLFGGIFHKGGKIPGNDQDVDITAQGGEFVVNRDATEEWEPLLQAINNGALARDLGPDMEPLAGAFRGASRSMDDLPDAIVEAVRSYTSVPEMERPRRKFATGGDMVVAGRTLMEVGEQGPERVQVTPINRPNAFQGRSAQLILQGPVIANDLSMKAFVRRLMRDIETEGRRLKK